MYRVAGALAVHSRWELELFADHIDYRLEAGPPDDFLVVEFPAEGLGLGLRRYAEDPDRGAFLGLDVAFWRAWPSERGGVSTTLIDGRDSATTIGLRLGYRVQKGHLVAAMQGAALLHVTPFMRAQADDGIDGWWASATDGAVVLATVGCRF